MDGSRTTFDRLYALGTGWAGVTAPASATHVSGTMFRWTSLLVKYMLWSGKMGRQVHIDQDPCGIAEKVRPRMTAARSERCSNSWASVVPN